MNRTPPKEVTEALRKEANLGCPVQGCGSPYLTWHHFDPPWSVREHHDPKGMIALCAEHHNFADEGRYTQEQLRQMKIKPFVTCDEIKSNYGFLRRKVVCIIGNVVYDAQTALEINGEQVIGFNVDIDGYSRLNLLIKDKDGKPILIMKDNFWTALRNDLFDLQCSLGGKVLGIISKDKETSLVIRYDDYSLAFFREKMLLYSKDSLNKIRASGLPEYILEILESQRSQPIDWFIHQIGSPKIVPTLTIKGKLLWSGVHLEICDGMIKNLVNNNIIGMNFLGNSKTALSFDGKPMRFGMS